MIVYLNIMFTNYHMSSKSDVILFQNPPIILCTFLKSPPHSTDESFVDLASRPKCWNYMIMATFNHNLMSFYVFKLQDTRSTVCNSPITEMKSLVPRLLFETLWNNENKYKDMKETEKEIHYISVSRQPDKCTLNYTMSDLLTNYVITTQILDRPSLKLYTNGRQLQKIRHAKFIKGLITKTTVELSKTTMREHYVRG